MSQALRFVIHASLYWLEVLDRSMMLTFLFLAEILTGRMMQV